MSVGLLGGTFNPPHNGHVELARAAEAKLGLDDLVVLVAARPGHKQVDLDAGSRLRLARAAFPGRRVELDEHERTVDMLRERRFDDAVFLIGADEFCDFLDWKDPNGVLELAPIAVATRPGYPHDRLDRVLDRFLAYGQTTTSIVQSTPVKPRGLPLPDERRD
jgi:nicotinate-nucleotide adenylyltransferase